MKSPSTNRNRLGWFLATSAMLIMVTCGCNLVATAIWVVTGDNVPAAYDGLKEKKVVVVCRGPSKLQLRDPQAPEMIAKRIGMFIQENLGKKVELVSHRKVSRFTDENNWHEYTEVGEKLDADIVIGVELVKYDLKLNELMRGHADITITVYDMKNKERVVFEKNIHDVKYPVMNEVSEFDVSPTHFRSSYIHYLSELVARHFYSHDPRVEPGPKSN